MVAVPHLALKIGDWSILEETILSDHRCIGFSLEQRSQVMEKGQGGRESSPTWNTIRVSRERPRKYLQKPGSLVSLIEYALLSRLKPLCAVRDRS